MPSSPSRDTRDTRDRMVRGAATMIGTRGVSGTSLRDLAGEAGVPLGSTYHYFPGGKRQLVEEAVTAVGEHISRIIESGRGTGAAQAVELLADEWRAILTTGGFRTGCAVLAAAAEDDLELRTLATTIFTSWHQQLADVLVQAGIPASRGPTLARTIIAAFEGAVALCRAERSLAPLDEVTAELAVLLGDSRI